VHLGDEIVADELGAGGGALVLVGAVAEAELVHLGDHVEHAAVALGLALREQRELRDLGRDEEHGGGVLAGRDAGAAADAGGGVHGEVGVLLGDGRGVGVLGGTGADADEAAGLLDGVERGAVADEVLDDRAGLGAVGLDGADRAVLEAAHVGLAGGDALVRA